MIASIPPIVDQVLLGIELTAPVELDDCGEVMSRLRAALGPGLGEITVRRERDCRAMLVEVRDGARTACTRTLEAS